MSLKRSRAAFEADLQAQQSPYVIYGTPLPPLDPDTRDDGSYVPVWKQEVTDEQGRKRLHGAFTGGFSAGYFNTVGSKEGWTPSAFVSSRSNRKKDAPSIQQRPEDFMDEEDMAEAEEARKLQTANSFAGLGTTADERLQDDSFMDILRNTGETIGAKLLKKMGWREGQGVGPKIRRKARLDEDQVAIDEASEETHLFAPDDSGMISFINKNDQKGLGFASERRLSDVEVSASVGGTREDEEGGLGNVIQGNKVKKKNSERKGGFGVGILNDDGSDDEDPYAMGPRISYNRVVGGDKKKRKKLEAGKSSANPLLNSKPVFISKKVGVGKANPNFRRCHDGHLPLDGFVFPSNRDLHPSTFSQDGKHPPPIVPADWKSSKEVSNSDVAATHQSTYKSTATVAAASKLDPNSRAALLGEDALPGKSVFDFLTPDARARIATATNNPNLPPALGEGGELPSPSHPKNLRALVPDLDRETALKALGRGTAGWMPYAEDPTKRARYRLFLEIHAGLVPEGKLPDRDTGASNDEWVKEMNEFAHAAQIFKPMTGMMATRFTSSSSAPKLASDNVVLEGTTNATGEAQLLQQPTGRTKTPAEEAAAVGMYGPLTRSVENFYPTRLLCKRFNVKPPAHVQTNPNNVPSEPGAGQDQGATPPVRSAVPQKNLEILGKSDMEKLLVSGRNETSSFENSKGLKLDSIGNGDEERRQANDEILVDPERNEALEKERPEDAVFKAIFGSDSEDE